MKFKRRTDIDNQTRAQIAMQAFLGHGVYGEITKIAKFYEVSRLFVYKLIWQLRLFYELELIPPISQKAVSVEIDRHILLLRLEGHCSLERISQIIKQLGFPFSSVGYISQRLTAYACALPKEKLSGVQMIFLLCDEIFTRGRPILITVDPHSLAIIKIELVKKRNAESWKKHWEELVEAGLITHPIVVSDQGSGLVKGCELMGLTHHPDLFHLLRGLARLGTRLYRKAIAAIKLEYARAAVIESSKTEGTFNKRLQMYETAKVEADKAISRYDDFCYLWKELRVALELFDKEGRIIEISFRKAQIKAVLDLMGELGDEKLNQELKSFSAGLEDYWGYYQRAAAVYGQLLERYPHEVVQMLAVGWQFKRQATNSKDYDLRKRLIEEAEFYFASAASLMPEQLNQYEVIRKGVIEALDSEVRSSSLVENVNSSLRALLESCRGQVKQDMLDLFAYVHNHRQFVRGKRVGQAPIEILTGKKMERTWLESLLDAA